MKKSHITMRGESDVETPRTKSESNAKVSLKHYRSKIRDLLTTPISELDLSDGSLKLKSSRVDGSCSNQPRLNHSGYGDSNLEKNGHKTGHGGCTGDIVTERFDADDGLGGSGDISTTLPAEDGDRIRAKTLDEGLASKCVEVLHRGRFASREQKQTFENEEKYQDIIASLSVRRKQPALHEHSGKKVRFREAAEKTTRLTKQQRSLMVKMSQLMKTTDSRESATLESALSFGSQCEKSESPKFSNLEFKTNASKEVQQSMELAENNMTDLNLSEISPKKLSSDTKWVKGCELRFVSPSRLSLPQDLTALSEMRKVVKGRVKEESGPTKNRKHRPDVMKKIGQGTNQDLMKLVSISKLYKNDVSHKTGATQTSSSPPRLVLASEEYKANHKELTETKFIQPEDGWSKTNFTNSNPADLQGKDRTKDICPNELFRRFGELEFGLNKPHVYQGINGEKPESHKAVRLDQPEEDSGQDVSGLELFKKFGEREFGLFRNPDFRSPTLLVENDSEVAEDETLSAQANADKTGIALDPISVKILNDVGLLTKFQRKKSNTKTFKLKGVL